MWHIYVDIITLLKAPISSKQGVKMLVVKESSSLLSERDFLMKWFNTITHGQGVLIPNS